MAAGDYVIPGATAVTEWGSRVGGFIAGCGEASLAVIQGIISGQPPSVQQVTALIQQGAATGYTGPTGVSTVSGLAQLGAASGTPLTPGSGANALSTINANLAAGLPTELGVSNATVFGGSDANVHGHYVTVVGKTGSGNYIVADPNQPAALSGGFVQYTAQQLTSAKPFGTLTPQSMPGPGIGGPISGSVNLPGGSPFSPQQWGQGFLQGITQAIGARSFPDLAWRTALIIGGMVLIVLGLLVFFSHQETSVVEQVTSQAKQAGKAAAAAAA